MSSQKSLSPIGSLINQFALGTLAHPEIIPAEPLWQRAPTHDDEGNLLSDFMMLIPKLSKRSHEQINQTLQCLQNVLSHYQNAIVFVDLNLRLNILWVSVKPIPGICLEVPTAIKASVHEALLVGQATRPS